MTWFDLRRRRGRHRRADLTIMLCGSIALAALAWPGLCLAQDAKARDGLAKEGIAGQRSAQQATGEDGLDASDSASVKPIFKDTSRAGADDGGPQSDGDAPSGDTPSDDDAFVDGLEVELHPSYRVRSIRVDPLDLSSEHVGADAWTQQRFRLGTKLSKSGLGAIHVQLDALDGVLFGDNGSFTGTPQSNSGVSLTAKRPNETGRTVGLEEGADPLDPDSYVPVLEGVDPISINYLYADIYLPIGLLRIGRQPLNYGATLSAHDGGPHNRWGASEYSDGVDRVLFGTKLDEAFRALSGAGGKPDLSMDNGFIWAVFYDLLKQDIQPTLGDNLSQIGTSFQLLDRQADWGDMDWQNLKLSGNLVYLSDERFGTQAFGLPLILEGDLEDVSLTLQYIHLQGHTREIAEGFAALTGNDPQLQDVRSNGAHAVLDWQVGPVTLTLQGDYASGDADPRSSNTLTSFSFARDLNVGLLLFERVLAFESARSVAVGEENLNSSEIKSFPLTEVKTDGRFTNAVAFFPQANIDWIDTPDHKFHTRLGALFAWPASGGGAVDPIMTTLNYDGSRIADDAVNFNGGAPGDYYGTEVDVQFGYEFHELAKFTVEGGMLFPGSSLEDEHGDATNSYLVEARFEAAL